MTTTTEEFVNYYEILGLAETADEDAVKTAIREQRRMWNKRAGQSDPVKRAQAEARVRHLGQAERVLLDTNRRRQFDQQARHYRPTSNQPAPVAQSGRDWLGLAREYFERGNAPSAYYCAREAISVNGADHEAWAVRANSSFVMGNYKDAGFEFREAIGLKPDSPEYHFDYAEAFLATGALHEALGEYETALRLAPGEPLYRTAIANVYLQQDKNDKALELMEDVVRHHPNEQIFQYYLALALEQVNLDMWSQVHSGAYCITSEAQIAVTRDMSGRALGLRFDDGPLRASLQENIELADKAAEARWFHTGMGPWAVALIIGLALIPMKGIGLLIVAAVVAGYTLTHRMPVWKHNSKRYDIVKRGI
ncbi:tetratricopeptide repeat protein [Nocardia gamkensis]|uniref:tetratricopeptide repeat protein n=1 Tax=Nocardia gamkensis TaxID=352869 RepID=UPI0036EEC770